MEKQKGHRIENTCVSALLMHKNPFHSWRQWHRLCIPFQCTCICWCSACISALCTYQINKGELFQKQRTTPTYLWSESNTDRHEYIGKMWTHRFYYFRLNEWDLFSLHTDPVHRFNFMQFFFHHKRILYFIYSIHS